MAVRPYAAERERQPVAYNAVPANPTDPPDDPAEYKNLYYPPSFPGDNKRGELIYVREGCAQCHTQVVRPDYAGVDQFKRFAGKEQAYEPDAIAPVRQTYPWDYMHEDFAMFGLRRVGPDLANLRYRYLLPATKTAPEQDKLGLDPAKVEKLYQHVYDPRSLDGREWSNCPASKHLFEVKEKESATGRGDALKLPAKLMPDDDKEIIPSDEAKDLVEYLLGLKRAAPVPSSITGIKPEKK
jgi:cbb3-type cytochrome oxidase cytochrome c subunit